MARNICVRIIILVILFSLLVSNLKVNAAKFNMSYLYGNFDYLSLVERTKNGLNEVSPSYFDLNDNGTLKLNTVDQNLIAKLHQMNVKVVPFLSNHWDREKGRSALLNKELANQIVSAVIKYNLDGVNIDIENLTEADRKNYTSFVKLLREKLPTDKSLSVAVSANPYGINVGWQGSYDYEALAKYSDYLMIMAYDEHYESGTAGPVASIDFVEKSIKYALTKVPKDKIVLGIPFYGRYWQDDSKYGGYGVSLTRIDKIINTYNSKINYDKNSESVKATVKITNSETKPVINGRTLYAGTYTFWYENEESIKAKIEIANKYDIKGTGSWSLGQELAETWEYYSDTLNEKENNVEDDWASDAIEYVISKGWMQGKANNLFAPKDNLTRAEFATIISRVMKLDKYSYDKTNYSDVLNHWAEKAIQSVTAAGYMKGDGDGNFRPNDTIKREEVAKVLSLLNVDTGGNVNLSFIDLDPVMWSYKYVINVAQKGLLKGYPDGTFKPKNSITRQEIAVILARIGK